MIRGLHLFCFTAAIIAASAVAQPSVPQTSPPLPPPPLPTTTPQTSPQSATASSRAGGECDRCGTVESIKRVAVKDQWTSLGTVSSSPLGSGVANPSSVTMYQIGPGFSKQGTVLVGAAGGAAYRTSPKELNAARWEVSVRMDAGGSRSVTQNYEPMLREGDRVRVLGTQLELMQ
jgi:outer membrane lipoprotein SlyB